MKDEVVEDVVEVEVQAMKEDVVVVAQATLLDLTRPQKTFQHSVPQQKQQ